MPFDKQRIVDLLAQQPMSQEAIRAAVREDKTLVKSALGLMARKGLIVFRQRDGLWHLKGKS